MSWRVFAALELPSELQQQLARLQEALKAAVPPRSVRWVRPEGIHLTLKFYGDIDPAVLPDLQAGLGRAAALVAPMQLTVAGVGAFPNAARPTVIWAGVSGQMEPLQRLQAAVEREAAPLGFSPEARGYTPHLTLGRVNAGPGGGEGRGLTQALTAERERQMGSFKPDHLSLMNSELRPGGSVYTELYRASLAAAKQPS